VSLQLGWREHRRLRLDLIEQDSSSLYQKLLKTGDVCLEAIMGLDSVLPHEVPTFAKVIRVEGTIVRAERLCVDHTYRNWSQ
jgi:hypothetical protein